MDQGAVVALGLPEEILSDEGLLKSHGLELPEILRLVPPEKRIRTGFPPKKLLLIPGISDRPGIQTVGIIPPPLVDLDRRLDPARKDIKGHFPHPASGS